MTLQERKDKVDIIAKQSEVINKKLIVYLAIAGGSWIYGTKESGIIGLFAFVLFMLVSVGVFVNLLKLNKIENEIEELKKDE
ncbi:MAG: hypothetical protein PHQ93_01805 [Sulfurimonas sp.]|uniref:hypothetical protein n=1 Tax=Sulfurimonas sp. TaxID=2022749 RepID=UPI00262B4882|nr:hypothetical protein [Sulfurimonas sp.]MDD5399910.1 hypothetical protein [Sulfurimonas sp.]